MNPDMPRASGSVDLDVIIEAPAWKRALPHVESICRTAATVVFEHAGWFLANAPYNGMPYAGGSVGACILLADDARLRDLNRVYRGVDSPTNVLSFPTIAPDVLAAIGADGPPGELGDVVVAFETTAAEAQRDAKPLADHLSHLVVHGILHLLGYDHELDAEAVDMEALEVRILAQLGIGDPYASVGDS